MKLNLRAALESILRFGRLPEVNSDLPISMVLLLREPRFHSLDRLRSAAESAFGIPYTEDKATKFFVMQVGLFTLIRAGRHTMNFLHVSRSYGEGDFPPDFANSFPKESQRRAWREHKAWSAVDYVKGGRDPELEYAVLAKLCAELIDHNCVGLYMPREQSLIANDDSLAEELRRISNSRDLELT